MKKRDIEKVQINDSLLELLAPLGIEIKTNRITTGDQLSKIYLIMKYPSYLSVGWLSEICSSIPSINVNVSISPVDNTEFIEQISKSLAVSQSIALTSKDELIKQRAELQVKNAKEIIKKIDQDNMSFVYMSISIKVTAQTETLLEKQCRRLESKLAVIGCKARIPANQIRDAYNHIAPFSKQDESIIDMSKQNVSLRTIAGGLPFHSSGHNDGQGFVLGVNDEEKIIAIDPFLINENRTNANWFIAGNSGGGKSFLGKKLLYNSWARGIKIIRN